MAQRKTLGVGGRWEGSLAETCPGVQSQEAQKAFVFGLGVQGGVRGGRERWAQHLSGPCWSCNRATPWLPTCRDPLPCKDLPDVRAH